MDNNIELQEDTMTTTKCKNISLIILGISWLCFLIIFLSTWTMTYFPTEVQETTTTTDRGTIEVHKIAKNPNVFLRYPLTKYEYEKDLLISISLNGSYLDWRYGIVIESNDGFTTRFYEIFKELDTLELHPGDVITVVFDTKIYGDEDINEVVFGYASSPGWIERYLPTVIVSGIGGVLLIVTVCLLVLIICVWKKCTIHRNIDE